MIFTELKSLRSLGMRHVDSLSWERLPWQFEKAAMSGLQVCDGDNEEEPTSHFLFGLLSFGSLHLRMSRKAAHTLYLYGLGAQEGSSSLQEHSGTLARQKSTLGKPSAFWGSTMGEGSFPCSRWPLEA